MIWQLIKRDQAWRCMPWLAAGGILATGLWQLGARDIPSLVIAYCVFSLTPAFASNVQMRDVYFEASLPVSVRQIYLSRVFSMLTLLWLPIAIGAAFGRVTSHPGLTLTVLDFGCLFMTAIMAVQSAAIQCKLRHPGIYAFNLFWLGGAGACAISGLPAWVLHQGAIATLAFPLVCWLVSGAIFVRTWQTLPKAFDFAPRMQPAVDTDKAGGGAQPFARWRLIVSLYSLHAVWVIYYLVIGAVLSSKWFHDSRVVLFLFLWLAWGSTRSKIRWFASLPVPPRTLLASILLPTMFLVSAGYEAGLHIPALADTEARGIWVTASGDTEIENLSKDCLMFNVVTPLDFRVRAQPDHAPVVHAPWGETYQPATNRIGGFDVYNPYASSCDSSERFLDWQLARATTAIYGTSNSA